MATAKIYNQKGESVGEMNLSDNIFGVKALESLVHQAMVAQMSNERQVLAHTKGRSDVRGGGKKPWKQKGTGRARQGSIRSPQWIGGGIVFGPTKDRNFAKKLNKKMKQKAMLMALSDKLAGNNLIVLDKIEMEEFKTKIFNKMLLNLEKILLAGEAVKKAKRSVLVINGEKDDKVKFSGKNLEGAEISNVNNINIVDLLKYKNLIITVDSIKKLEEIYR